VGGKMTMMVKILKSDNIETEERQIARLKKEITLLTEDLQLREMTLEQLE
jgi:hypothetical protein